MSRFARHDYDVMGLPHFAKQDMI